MLGLIQATDGNFYGMTYSGGAYGVGTFYKITPQRNLHSALQFRRVCIRPILPDIAPCRG